MKLYESNTVEANIVFNGSFNPAIFHPEWLLRNELISIDDMKGRKVEVVHNDISKFSLEWLGIDVLSNKFISRTNDPSKFSPLRDLMVSVFKILEHTPITQIGMNLIADFKINSEENWHKIGDNLAPKDLWEKSLPKRVGLKSIKLSSPRPEGLNGTVNVGVDSFSNEPIPYGVRFNINNHVEIDEANNVPSILADQWDQSLALAFKICDVTLSEALGE